MSEKYSPQIEQENDNLDLHEFLSYQNPYAEEYAKLIESLPSELGWNLDLDFVGIMLREGGREEFFAEALRPRIEGGVVVDLGCGGVYWNMLELIEPGHPKEYIGVDKFFSNEYPLDPYSAMNSSNSEHFPGIHVNIVKADMLDFVSKMQNESANISLSGVDLAVINNYDYHKALAREIERVVPVGGVIISAIASTEAINYLDKERFKREALHLYVKNG